MKFKVSVLFIIILISSYLYSRTVPINELSKIAFSNLSDYVNNGGDLNIQDNRGINLLMLCAINGNIAKTKFLIESGININHKSNNGMNAFHSAIMSFMNNIEIMDLLLSNGINIHATYWVADHPMDPSCENPNLKKSYNWNALLLASTTGNVAIVEYLLKHNFNIDHKNSLGETSLHIAAKRDYDNAILIFLSKKYKQIDLKDNEGFTPFMISIDYNSYKNAKYLLEKGADINSQDYKGNTALHYAISEKSYGAVELLLENKANLFINNKKAQTQMELIKEINDTEINEILRKYS